MSNLTTDESGRTVTSVNVTRDGKKEQFCADIVVVACGALSSALLLLRSANDKHPKGLANGSGQVGRNYMRHNQSILMALMWEPNETVFQKTLAVSDFYFGSDDWDYPLGLIQMCATSHGAQIRGEALPSWLQWAPRMPFDEMARHSMDFWLSSEDLPCPGNRIYYEGERVVLDIGVASLSFKALAARQLSSDAEQRNYSGQVLDIDGVRLRYIERGSGEALVLIHGNGTQIEDFETSGLIDLAAKRFRVIVFDRPGFGLSSRPRGKVWTPSAQADLLHKAITRRRSADKSEYAIDTITQGNIEQLASCRSRPWSYGSSRSTRGDHGSDRSRGLRAKRKPALRRSPTSGKNPIVDFAV